VRFVYLDVPADVLTERLKERRGHFFAVSMLGSQLEVLEVPGPAEPAPVIIVDATRPVDEVVRQIVSALFEGGGAFR
jgi:gluconokinase